MEEWKEYKLKDITSLITKGTTPSMIGANFTTQGIKFIKSECILENSRLLDSSKYTFISSETNERLKRSQIIENDILFSMAGMFLGKTGIATKDDVPANTNQAVAIIRIIPEKADFKYVYYFLNQKSLIIYINGISGQSAQPNINLQQIGDLSINLPPLPTQQKIAAILSSLDDKIELNNKINENLEQQAQAIFEEKFGLFKIAHNESEKITLPNDWLYYSFDSLCSQIKPGTNFQPTRVTEGIPFLNVKNITEGYINKSDIKFISTEDFMKVHKTWMPEENDILLSRIGTLGLVAVIRKTDLPLAVHYNFIDIKVSKIPFEFLYFLLKSENFKNVYKLITKQSVQEYVTIDEVAALSIPLPKLENYDYKKFNIFKNLYKQIETNQLENAQLIIIRDTLLPKLMNGEIETNSIIINKEV